MKIAASRKKMHVLCCYWRCLIELTKQWTRDRKYEVECIKTMEWVEYYKYFSKLKKCTYHAVTDDVRLNRQKMNDIDELWRWVH